MRLTEVEGLPQETVAELSSIGVFTVEQLLALDPARILKTLPPLELRQLQAELAQFVSPEIISGSSRYERLFTVLFFRQALTFLTWC